MIPLVITAPSLAHAPGSGVEGCMSDEGAMLLGGRCPMRGAIVRKVGITAVTVIYCYGNYVVT